MMAVYSAHAEWARKMLAKLALARGMKSISCNATPLLLLDVQGMSAGTRQVTSTACPKLLQTTNEQNVVLLYRPFSQKQRYRQVQTLGLGWGFRAKQPNSKHTQGTARTPDGKELKGFEYSLDGFVVPVTGIANMRGLRPQRIIKHISPSSSVLHCVTRFTLQPFCLLLLLQKYETPYISREH
jgi:hypothetical protein